jgi:hypothetical protein
MVRPLDGFAAVDPLAGHRVVARVHADAERVATAFDPAASATLAFSPAGLSIFNGEFMQVSSGAGGVRTHDLTDYEGSRKHLTSHLPATMVSMRPQEGAAATPTHSSSRHKSCHDRNALP